MAADDTRTSRLVSIRAPRRPEQVLHGVGRLPCEASPASYLAEHIEPEYRSRIPHLEVHDDGAEYSVTEGNRPIDDQAADAVPCRSSSRSSGRAQPQPGVEPGGRDVRNTTGRTIEERLADQARDGVDVELIFPNKGLLCWATPDPVFADAMCRAWNRWAYEFHGGATVGPAAATRPLASIATGDIELRHGRGRVGRRARLRRPVPRQRARSTDPSEWGNLEYNDPASSAFWSLVEETGPADHVPRVDRSRPRAVGGNGGAIINYVCHSMETTIEPLVQLITVGRVRAPPRPAGRPRRDPASASCRGCSRPWTTPTGPTTSGCAR